MIQMALYQATAYLGWKYTHIRQNRKNDKKLKKMRNQNNLSCYNLRLKAANQQLMTSENVVQSKFQVLWIFAVFKRLISKEEIKHWEESTALVLRSFVSMRSHFYGAVVLSPGCVS